MTIRTLAPALLGTGLALTASLEAKTLALWPLEGDASGKFDGRCLVNPAGGLALNNAAGLSLVPTSLGWQQPPNADPFGHWVEINNQKAVAHTGAGGAFACLNAATPELFHAFSLGDFTVEGWVKFESNQARGAWKPYFAVAAGGVNIMLSLRHIRTTTAAVSEDNPKGYIHTLECYYRGANVEKNPGGDHTLFEISESEIDAFLASWHHLAVSLDHSNPISTRMRFYLDGVLKTDMQVAKFRMLDGDAFVLRLGGRESDSIAASYDYWRISDEALQPEEFLNYDPEGKGGKTVVETPTTTVAYWKLDPDEQGNLDLRNSVGDNAHLRKPSFASPPPVATDLQWAEVNAFEPVVGGRDGNGSASLQHPGMGLKAHGLGRQLMPTNSFTVEGWYNPEQGEGAATFDTNAFGRVFAVADPDTVWSLQLKKKPDGSRVFAVEAADDVTKGGGAALASGEFAAVLPREAAWHRLSLAYDAAAGNGRWTFAFDDAVAGSVDNVRAPTYGGAISAENAYLGSTTIPGSEGRSRTRSNPDVDLTIPARAANDWVFGVYDSWSVTKDGVTVAQWGLDVRQSYGNVWLHCRDAKGAYHFTGEFCNNSSLGNVVLSDDCATVTNPDRSAAFRGSPSANAGSAKVTASKGSPGFFVCDDPRVLELFGDGTKDFTFEYYQKRNCALQDWEIVISGDTENFAFGTSGLNFSQRKNGFYLWMNAMNVSRDALFADSAASVNDTTTWHHVALVRRYDPSANKVTASLYEDGVLCSSVEGTPKRHALVNVTFFGRSSGNGVCAAVDEMRLSSAALAPSQFLCASPEPAVTPQDNTRKTLGYWELDNRDGEADLKNAVVSACPLEGVATGAASVFSRKMRNPDDTERFEGVAAVDEGSVVAETALASAFAGATLELDRPFTVEGWFKPVEPGTAGTEVCRVSNAAGDGFWEVRLVRDDDAVKLAVKAVSPHSWTLCAVDGAFAADFVRRIGTWTHIAVSYDPTGIGSWHLLVNGEDGGSLDNAKAPGSLSWGLSELALGSAAGGAFDEWRVSRGILTAEDILYRAVPGLLLLVR